MHDERKKNLMKLGSEALADLLLEMAKNIEEVDDRINRLVAPEWENIQRFKRKIAALKNNTTFIGYAQVFPFSLQLSRMLADLGASVQDPCAGLDLVTEFFETDSSVFEYSDDDGIIGNVYLREAKELFVTYASRCPDTEKVASLVVDLYAHDQYGARTSLLEDLCSSFTNPVITAIQKYIETLANTEKDTRKQNTYSRILDSVSEQMHQAHLFAQALEGKDVELPPLAILRVSRRLLEKGEVEAAHRWIEKIPHNSSISRSEIDTILKKIYAKKGDTESLIALYRTKLRSLRTFDSFQELLKVAGEEKRDELLAQEVLLINEDTTFDTHNAQFLADVGLFDALEAYLFARVEHMHGGLYYALPDIAQALADNARYLAATLIYRALVNSIMERAYATSYHHGIDYLLEMDRLAPSIKDWMIYPTHNAYKVKLLQANRRKTSFWTQYTKSTP